MIIDNLQYLEQVFGYSQVKGGGMDSNFDNRANAEAFSYANGLSENYSGVAALVYVAPGISRSQSFSEAITRS